MKRVTVQLPLTSYDVVIGDGARETLAQEIRRTCPSAKTAVVVTQENIIEAGWIDALDAGLPVHVLKIGHGEDSKSLETVEELCRAFVEVGLTRQDLVIGVGGGLVSDVAGFAASIYHRATPYGTVATSLLAQVDAAIGGKTGVNLPEGKNLVGSFHQPRFVLCDTAMLSTLPPAEWRCGRGEMAKYAFLSTEVPSAKLLDLSIEDQVARCVAIKADVVSSDEFETGRRMILNYGHTLAHALEAVGLEDRAAGRRSKASELAHGEAVAVGIAFAARLAQAMGRIDAKRVALHDDVVAGFDVNPGLPLGLNADELVAFMMRDKKAHHNLTFVLDGPNGVEIVAEVDPRLVVTTLLEMGANP